MLLEIAATAVVALIDVLGGGVSIPCAAPLVAPDIYYVTAEEAEAAEVAARDGMESWFKPFNWTISTGYLGD